MSMIPYVISESYPDHKRPWVRQEFGVIKEEDLLTFFVEQICEFVMERTDITSCQDINVFFDTYYVECYMSNKPWEASVFINGVWKNIIPTNTQIWDYIQFLKLQNKRK